MEELSEDDSLVQNEYSIEKQSLIDSDYRLEEEQIREIVLSSEKISDITILLYIGSGLVALLFVLLYFFFFPVKRKKGKKKKNKKRVHEKRDFEVLLNIINNKEAGTKELKEAIDGVIRDYGKIHEFHNYLDILYRLPVHPSANKKMISSFDKKLSALNPDFKDKIGKAVASALKGRAKHLPL